MKQETTTRAPAQAGAAPAQQQAAATPAHQQQAQRSYAQGLQQKGEAPGEAQAAAKQGPPASGLDAVGNYLDNFKVKRGEFVDLDFKVQVPAAQLPGAMIRLATKGSFAVDQAGNKEMEATVGVGLGWTLFEVIKANVMLNFTMKLSGKDLGAAFVDALKQNVAMHLRASGVDKQLSELYRLATVGPTSDEKRSALIPIFGTVDAMKIALAKYQKDRIVSNYRAYREFFKNNPEVGFETSAALTGTAEAGKSTKGGVTAEVRAGLEDVNKKNAKAFVEGSWEVYLVRGNNTVKFKVSRRDREDGSQLLRVAVKSTYSIAKHLSMNQAAGAFAKGIGPALQLMVGAAGKTKDKGGLPELSMLANAALDTAGSLGSASKHLDSLVGLDANLDRVDGVWSKHSAKLKSMTQMGTGTKESVNIGVAKVEANVQIGTFVDVSNDFAAALKA
jgi:hypothetical protein